MASRLLIIVVAIAVCCLLSTDAMALKAWEAGVKLGAHGAELRGDQVGLYVSVPPTVDVRGPIGDSKIGFVGGGFIRRNFNDMFGLQVEALYSQKGGKGNVVGTVEYQASNNEVYPGAIDGELTMYLDYIEVPVLAVFSFEADEKFTLVAELGASFAVNTNAELELKGEASFDQPSFTKVIKNFDQKTSIGGHINTFDFGGVIGGGVEVLAGNTILYFDARLTFGITSIDQDDNQDVYNQVVSVFAGVGIPFGSEM